jgi:tRNA (uracil-5-)-methyltransferase
MITGEEVSVKEGVMAVTPPTAACAGGGLVEVATSSSATAEAAIDERGGDEEIIIDRPTETMMNDDIIINSTAGKPPPPNNTDDRLVDNHHQQHQLAYDHTNRRVIVHNVLRYLKEKQIDTLVSSWLVGHETAANIIVVKAKKPPKDNWLKVTLAHENMVQPFITLINTGGVGGTAQLNSRGQPVRAERDNGGGGDNHRGGGGGNFENGGNKRKELHDNDNDRRNNNEESNINNHTYDNKRYKSSQESTTTISSQPTPRILSANEVRDAITPYWALPYQKQLDIKMKELINKCAKTIIKDIKSKFKLMEREYSRDNKKCKSGGGTSSGVKLVLYDWVNQLRAIAIDEILPSPLQYEYRNKCEFTFGYRLVPTTIETSMKTVVVDTVKVEAVDDVVVNDGMSRKQGGEEENSVDNITMVGKMCDDIDMATKMTTTTTTSSSVPTTEFHKVPAAGFLPQGWNGGIYLPHALQNMPNWSCGIADIFNNNFLPSSPLPPYDSKVHCGIWRTVTVRCSLRTKECMIIVVHASPKAVPLAVGARKEENEGLDDHLTVFNSEKARLVSLLTNSPIPTPIRDFPDNHNGDDMILPSKQDVTTKKVDYNNDKEDLYVTSIYFQEFDGVSLPGPDHPVQHVYGKKYIEETLGNCTFQISPGAFFQTNTEGAEVLYNIIVDRIREVTTDPQRTLLLDVCCGTGTIGLTCLKEGVVGKLIGIDIAEPAIADAKINAEKNGYHNNADESNANKGVTRFVASAAEKIMPEIMKEITTSIREGTTTTPLVVAVVDPARNGLHAIVVRTLRANERIQRLIYVSCNPVGTLTRDVAMLCGPPTKKYPGRPFKPTRSQPMDMFPMTKHCEMVMTLDRMSKEEYEKYQT